MTMNDTTAARYMHSGPVLPGETDHQAMGENTAYSIGGHLLTPGQSIEHEPVDDAERAAQHTAQAAYKSAIGELQNGQQDSAPAFDLNEAAGNIRSALRPGVK
jgi:hypothetical protein